MGAQAQSTIEPPGGGSAPTQTEFNAFADAMSTSYGAAVELVSVDPLTGARTELADTSLTNLLAELPVLETQANGANLGLQLADGTQVQFANTGRLATWLYSVAVQQMQATSSVTDNYNLDMQWLSNVDQPLLDEADYWSERSAAEASTNKEASIEDNVQAYLAMQIAAEAPGSRQDAEETIKNAATGNPTQISVWYSGDGSKIHDVATPISQYIEAGISTAVNLAALATGQAYLYYAAAAIDAAQAGQDFSNGQDLAGILSAAKALSAGITGGAGAPSVGVALTTAQTTAAVINAAALGVGGVYGIVQSAQNGNALGIAAGAFEAAAGAAAGIGLVPGIDDQTVTTLSQVAVALGQTGLVTNMASDFSSGHLGQGLIDSLNLYLPELAGAYQNWVNGSGPATQGATSSTVPAQQISRALTQDGGLPLVGLAVAASELTGDPVPQGSVLSPEDSADLKAQLLMVENSPEGSADLEYDLDATVTVPAANNQAAGAVPTGTEENAGNMITITLPQMDTNWGARAPSFDEFSPNAGTVVVTPGPGMQDIVPSMTITATPNGDVVTQGAGGSAATNQNGSGGGSGAGSTTPSGGSASGSSGVVTPNTATINIGNLLSQAVMNFIPPAGAATPTSPQTVNLALAKADLAQPNVKAFLQTIAAAEHGDYNIVNTGVSVTNLALFPAPTAYGSAAGEYQILAPTYKLLSAQLGLTDWSAQTQDLMGAFILQKIGVVADLQAGNLSAAIAAASGQWSAVPMSSTNDHSRYLYSSGTRLGQYQPAMGYQDFVNLYHANGGH